VATHGRNDPTAKVPDELRERFEAMELVEVNGVVDARLGHDRAARREHLAPLGAAVPDVDAERRAVPRPTGGWQPALAHGWRQADRPL